MITVFIATYNRLDTLARTVASYERFGDQCELVIVDNGTDNQKCINMLDEIERMPQVKRVYTLSAVASMEELTDNFNIVVKDQYRSTGREWFAISDADISFEQTSSGALRACLLVAKKTGRPAGCHLRVDAGIPASYPLRSRVLACESRILYRDSMQWMRRIPYSSWQIDTTFHLFPRTDFFSRLHMNPLRVGPPYDAMHLDWYLDIFNPTEENAIYIKERDTTVGSWGSQWLTGYWNAFQEQGPEYAYEVLNESKRAKDDLCVTSFMLSWCHQYGVGVEPSESLSVQHLLRAIPRRFSDYWENQKSWWSMIYDNDFSSLGWS